jgi:hypothetical protein
MIRIIIIKSGEKEKGRILTSSAAVASSAIRKIIVSAS